MVRGEKLVQGAAAQPYGLPPTLLALIALLAVGAWFGSSIEGGVEVFERRRAALRSFDHLRCETLRLRDLDAGPRALRIADLREEVLELDRQWRSLQPTPGFAPVLQQTRAGLALVLNPSGASLGEPARSPR